MNFGQLSGKFETCQETLKNVSFGNSVKSTSRKRFVELSEYFLKTFVTVGLGT